MRSDRSAAVPTESVGRVRRAPLVANPVQQTRVGVAERRGRRGDRRQPHDADQDVGGEVVAHRADEDAEVVDREVTLVEEVPEARVLDALVVLPLDALAQVELPGGGLTGRLDEEEQLADAGRPERPALVQGRVHRTVGHVDDADRPLARREIGELHPTTLSAAYRPGLRPRPRKPTTLRERPTSVVISAC